MPGGGAACNIKGAISIDSFKYHKKAMVPVATQGNTLGGWEG